MFGDWGAEVKTRKSNAIDQRYFRIQIVSRDHEEQPVRLRENPVMPTSREFPTAYIGSRKTRERNIGRSSGKNALLTSW